MWIVFSFASALTESVKNIVVKHNTKTFNPLVISWAWFSYSLIILLPVMFVKGIPDLDGTFWFALVSRTILDVIAAVLYTNSIKRTDVSFNIPMLAFTPLFLLFSGLIINKEFPNFLGLLGVTAIILGAYLLNFKKNETIYQPFLAIVKNQGTMMMLGVAVIWGLTGSLHKLAILHSDPYFYAGFGSLVLALTLTPLAATANKNDFYNALKIKNISKLSPVGILNGVSVLTQMIGQSLTLAVFVISVKRTSIIFSAILAWLVFKEPIKYRIFPIILMVTGIILISLSS